MQVFLAELAGKYKWSFLAAMLLFSFCALVSLPILQAGFYSDDILDSILRGSIELQNQTFSHFIADKMKEWFASGRFFPLSVLSGISMFYFFPQPLDYQIVRVIFIWLSILSFAWLLSLIAKDRIPGLLLIFLVPLCWSVKKSADPLVSFALLLPLVTLFTALTLVFFIKFQETQRLAWIAVSSLMYICALSMYELGIVAFPLLIMLILLGPYPRKQYIGYLKPYLVITAVYAIINAWLRYHSSYTYIGIQASVSEKFWITFFKQLSASLPLSYHVFFPISQMSFLSAETILFSASLFGLAFIGIYYLLDRLFLTSKTIICFTGIGLVLVIFPAFLISLSIKYQNMLEFGKGYLPVYMQYSGIAILLLTFLGLMEKITSNVFFKKSLVFVCALLCSIVMVASVLLNMTTIRDLNNQGSLKRALVEEALQQGLFLKVPQNAVLAEQRLLWNNVEFYKMHANVKLSAVINLNDVNLTGDNQNLFLIDAYSVPGTKDGYVMMGLIKHIHYRKINALKVVDGVVVKNPRLFISAGDLAHRYKIIENMQSRFQLSQQVTNHLARAVTKTNKNIPLLTHLPAGEYHVLFK